MESIYYDSHCFKDFLVDVFLKWRKDKYFLKELSLSSLLEGGCLLCFKRLKFE